MGWFAYILRMRRFLRRSGVEVDETEVKNRSLKELFKKLIPRVLKATVVTAIVGACLLFFWLVISAALEGWYPEYNTCFVVFAWATIFFTFAIRVADGTIFKYCFIIGRAFFLIIYGVYATNGGILTIDFMNFHFTLEFIPLLSLMILVNLLAIARGMLQAIEFMSESPKE